MIHRFDLTVKKELTKERGGRTPDFSYLHCAEEELSARTNSRTPRMKWGVKTCNHHKRRREYENAK